MKIEKIDNIKEEMASVDCDGEELVKEHEERIKKSNDAIKEISTALDKEGGITGSTAQKPAKVELPKVKLEEALFEDVDIKATRYYAQKFRDFPEPTAEDEKALDNAINKLAEKGIHSDDVLNSFITLLGPVVVLQMIDDCYQIQNEDSLTEGEEGEEDKVDSQEGKKPYLHVIFTDEQSKDFTDEDDIEFIMESEYNLTVTNVRHNATDNVWEADLEGSEEDLKNYAEQNGIESDINYKITQDSWKNSSERDTNLRDVRWMVMSELSTDPLIEPEKLRIPYSEIPQRERYKTEDSKAALGVGNTDLIIDEDGNYVIHQDSPDKLEFAKKVAEVYNVPYEYKEEKWKRDPNERYSIVITIPEETDGVDLFKKAKK